MIWINISFFFSKLHSDPIILPFLKYLVKISLEILDTPLVMKFMVQCKAKYGQAPPIIFPMAAPDGK